MEQVVLKPMMFEGLPSGVKSVDSVGEIIQNQLIAVSQVKTISKVREVIEAVLKANVVILTEGESQALVADLKVLKNEVLKSRLPRSLFVALRTGLRKR